MTDRGTCKIGIWSNAPFGSSGYACQTRVLLTMLLSLGHQCVVIANSGYTQSTTYYPAEDLDGNVHDIPVFPLPRPMDNRFMCLWAEQEQCDVLILFGDAQNLAPHEWVFGEGYDPIIIVYAPLDHDNAINQVINPLRAARAKGAEIVAYSYHARDEFEAAGIRAQYIPHAIDTRVFQPDATRRWDARSKWGIPEDRYVVGIVAANNDPAPTRKGWEAMIEGVRLAQQADPSILLYLHTNFYGRWDLLRHLQHAGVEYMASPPLIVVGGVPDDAMASLYCAFEVLLLASTGEGCGLPIVEANAVGTPVITSSWTACPEYLTYGMMLRIKANEVVLPDDCWNGGLAYRYQAEPLEIAQKILRIKANNWQQELADDVRVRRGSTSFSAHRVAQHWRTLISFLLERKNSCKSSEIAEVSA